MGQYNRDRALLWLRWQPHRLGTLEQLERRPSTYSFLHGLQIGCLDILSLPRQHVRRHVR